MEKEFEDRFANIEEQLVRLFNGFASVRDQLTLLHREMHLDRQEMKERIEQVRAAVQKLASLGNSH